MSNAKSKGSQFTFNAPVGQMVHAEQGNNTIDNKESNKQTWSTDGTEAKPAKAAVPAAQVAVPEIAEVPEVPAEPATVAPSEVVPKNNEISVETEIKAQAILLEKYNNIKNNNNKNKENGEPLADTQIELKSHLLSDNNNNNTNNNNNNNKTIKGDEPVDIVLGDDIGEEKESIHELDGDALFYVKQKHCKNCLHSLSDRNKKICCVEKELCEWCELKVPQCVMDTQSHACQSLFKVDDNDNDNDNDNDGIMTIVDDEIDWDTILCIEKLLQSSYDSIMKSSEPMSTFNETLFNLFESLLSVVLTPFVLEKRVFNTKDNKFLLQSVTYYELEGIKEIIKFIGFTNVDNGMGAYEILSSKLKNVKLCYTKCVICCIYNFCNKEELRLPLLHPTGASGPKLIATRMSLNELDKSEKKVLTGNKNETKMKVMRGLINKRVEVFLDLFKELNPVMCKYGATGVPATSAVFGKMILPASGAPTTMTVTTKTIRTAATALSDTFDNNNNNNSNIIKSRRIVGRTDGGVGNVGDNDDKSDESEMNELIGQMSDINIIQNTTPATVPPTAVITTSDATARATATVTAESQKEIVESRESNRTTSCIMSSTDSNSSNGSNPDGSDRSDASDASHTSPPSRATNATSNARISKTDIDDDDDFDINNKNDNSDEKEVDIPPKKRQRLN